MVNAGELAEHVRKSIKLGNQGKSSLTKDDFALIKYDGQPQLSGLKTMHFLNNLCNMDDCRHLAIGVYKGGTICSALVGNKVKKAMCIDNWCHNDADLKIRPAFFERLTKLGLISSIDIIENDCFSVDVSKLGKYNVYFYDGAHDYDDQYRAISYFYDCLDDVFIYAVDDYRVINVKEGTADAIRDRKLKVVYEKELPGTRCGDKNAWWRGLYVAVLEKEK